MNAVVQSVTVVHTLYAVCTRGRKEGSEKKGSAKKKKEKMNNFAITSRFFDRLLFSPHRYLHRWNNYRRKDGTYVSR